MADYYSLNKQELEKEFSEVCREYEHYRSMHLSLDMSRGDNVDFTKG